MDRVLLLFDDIQYTGHIEKTLRKVGFDTEVLANEYQLNEKILTFNPDFIVVKGDPSSRVSSLQIGKKLKEAVKFNGRIILIFPENAKPAAEDLIKLRMDLLLVEPISAMRLTGHILSLSGSSPDAVVEKLQRLAQTDTSFRESEQQILRLMGESIDTEIQLISSKLQNEKQPDIIDDNAINSFLDPQYRKNLENSAENQTDAIVVKEAGVDPEYQQKLKAELLKSEEELPLRIETYNQAISEFDQDLSKGISKRQTKKKALELLDVTSAEEKKDRDEERKKFAKALWKK